MLAVDEGGCDGCQLLRVRDPTLIGDEGVSDDEPIDLSFVVVLLRS